MKNFWHKLKSPILALAPMAGVSDSAFRQMCKYYGADVVYTEMVSADGLYYDSKKTLKLLKFKRSEKPIVIQLFGKNPDTFKKAAQICEKHGFDGIDINFGCPARKVVAHGGGVTLMRNLPKCKELIEAAMSGTKLPVSIKVRASIKQDKSDKRITALDFVRYIKDLPVAAIMIHGRPHENPFSAPIDYEMIKKVKKEFKGVVLGNGGINTPEEAKMMMEKTGADGVGLARGLYGKPWLFEQVRDYIEKGEYKEYGRKDVNKAILRHAKIALKAKGEHGLIELRKHLLWYVAGFMGAKKLRSELVKIRTIADIKKVLK